MTPERQRTSEARLASPNSTRPASTPELSEEDLVAVSRPGVGGPPELVIPGDGRFVLNTAAMRLLSPKTPLAAVRFYLAEKGRERFLVVRPASKNATDAIKIYRTGRFYQDRWPAIVMGRAATTLRKIGVVERYRLEGVHDRKNNWLVFNLNRPKPLQDIEGIDPMGQAVSLWLKATKRKRTIVMKDAFEEVREAWEKEAAKPNSSVRGPFPFDKPIRLGAYLRKHAGEYTKEGLRLGGSGIKPPVILE